MKHSALLSCMFVFVLLVSNLAFASGYRIPQNSGNSLALSSAYIANTDGADTAYYNPANMAWEDDQSKYEINLYYVTLPEVDFKGTVSGANADSKSLKEEFFIPNLFYMSRKDGRFRYGLSMVAPFGLSKRWADEPQRTSAENFTLKVIEVNPTFSYLVNDKFSIGGGIRGIFTSGEVVSYGTTLISGSPAVVSRALVGSSYDFGYNLAATYKSTENLKIGFTYRSEVNPNLVGNATLSESLLPTTYSGGANLDVALPANFAIGISYVFDKTTVEFVFDRTFWSAYSKLDFDYDGALSAVLVGLFDDPVDKDWKDSDAYGVGITHRYNDHLKLMAGFLYEFTPIPTKTLGFDLPDSDSVVFSAGAKHKSADNLALGISLICNKLLKRRVSNNNGGIDGTFESSAVGVLASISREF